MTTPRLLGFVALVLFGAIGIVAWMKSNTEITPDGAPIVLDLQVTAEPIPVVEAPSVAPSVDPVPLVLAPAPQVAPVVLDRPVPQVDRINEFFNKKDPHLPIVETITYQSKVSWLKGRPAWIADYANHYKTSRHFIARSLNNGPDYEKQVVAEGQKFNVLSPNKKIEFYLLVDVNRNKMWFYYIDKATQERTLVKTYDVGLGRDDATKPSGCLTPLGKYTLGSNVASYKPDVKGFHNGEKVEMITIFGSRWIPFDEELEGTAPVRGLGIHGSPWVKSDAGAMKPNETDIGRHASDGCIRLATPDMEELYAIIISRPTTIELVKDYYEASLPGTEKAPQG